MSDDSGVPIIKINVDDSEFSAFLAKYAQYQEAVKESPSAWQNTNASVKELKGGFEGAVSEFMKLDAAVINPQFAKVFNDFGRISMASQKAWHMINTEIGAVAKNMSLLGRLSLQFGAGLGIAAGAGVAGLGAAFGAVAQASGDVSKDYKTSKNLGLELGKEKAFNTYFDTYGLGTSDLETSANNAGRMKNYAPYAVAGVTQDEYHSDPEELTYIAAKKFGAKYAELEQNYGKKNAGDVADAMGLTKIFTNDQLRNLAHSGPDAIDQSQHDFSDNWQKMGVSEKQAKDATAFDQHQAANWQEIKNTWDEAVLVLAPALNKWSDAATKWTVAALKETGNQAADVANDLNSPEPMGPVTAENYKQYSVDTGLRMEGQYLRDGWSKIESLWNSNGGIQSGHDAPKLTWDMKHPLGTFHGPDESPAPPAPGLVVPDPDRDAHQVDTDQLQGFPLGSTKTIEWLESHNHPEAQGPVTKSGERAQGAFQFMSATADANGLKNRYDEAKSMDAFGMEFARLRKEFGGDESKAAAAYNWGEGKLQKLLADYPNDWRNHLPEASKKYVAGYEEGIGRNGGRSVSDQMAALPAPKQPEANPSSNNDSSGDFNKLQAGYAFRHAPQVTHVSVTAPAGSNTNVTTGANAQ